MRCGKRRAINKFRPQRRQCMPCENELRLSRREKQDKLSRSLALIKRNRASNAEQRRRDAAADGIYGTGL